MLKCARRWWQLVSPQVVRAHERVPSSHVATRRSMHSRERDVRMAETPTAHRHDRAWRDAVRRATRGRRRRDAARVPQRLMRDVVSQRRLRGPRLGHGTRAASERYRSVGERRDAAACYSCTAASVRKNAAHFVVKSIENSTGFMVWALLLAVTTFKSAMQHTHGGRVE